MKTPLVLAPISGFRLRVTDQGITDAGAAYVFGMEPRPITIADNPDIPAIWQRMGLEIRHFGDVDLLVTPIVDSVELTAQQFPLVVVPGTTDERRSVLSGRFFKFGTKCSALIETNTLPTLFNIDGMWFEGAPQLEYRVT